MSFTFCTLAQVMWSIAWVLSKQIKFPIALVVVANLLLGLGCICLLVLFCICFFLFIDPQTGHRSPKGNIAMVTRQDDPQWSKFVFWTVSATIIAEEQSITRSMSNDIDYISLFGPSLKGMFCDWSRG